MSCADYTFCAPTKIVFGKGVIKGLGAAVKAAGFHKVMVTMGQGSVRRNGVYDAVVASLREAGIQFAEYSGINPNPLITKVREAAQRCKEEHVEAIVAVGGGSTNDASKVIAAAAAMTDGDIWEVVEGRAAPPASPLPLFTVLTMSGTGSEYNNGAVVTDPVTHHKRPVFFNFPLVSFIDPTVQGSLPWRQTCNGCVDAISHLLEQLMGARDQDTTINLNISLIRSVMNACTALKANEQDYSARYNFCWAASLALNGIANCGLMQDWNVHWMEHACTGYKPTIDHGQGLAILTGPYMAYLVAHCPAAMPAMERLGSDLLHCTAAEVPARLRAQFAAWGAPVTLREVGLTEADLPRIAKLYEEIGMKSDLCTLSAAQVEEILRAAL